VGAARRHVSFAGYPLAIDETIVGVVALFARRPLSDVTLQTLASTATLLAQFIRRKRTEDALVSKA
jgi:hypothetical protein